MTMQGTTLTSAPPPDPDRDARAQARRERGQSSEGHFHDDFPMSTTANPRRTIARSCVTFWAVGALFVLGLWGARLAAQALLLTFMGVLFGTALRGLAERAAQKSGRSVRWTLAALLGVLALMVVGAALWIVPHVAAQASTLAEQAGDAYSHVSNTLPDSALGQRILSASEKLGQQLGGVLAHTAGVLASAGGALGAGLFVAFTALYVATAPDVYRNGALRLIPKSRRERFGHVLAMLASTLRRWLLGRCISMTAVGALTAVGLWLIGVPLPVTLGGLAGALGFVPNIGPIVSAIPALLIALTGSLTDAALVAGLYLAINFLDGYLLTPWLQKEAVSVPPALILCSQVVLGAFWGVLGVMLATPICACSIVVVRELYVKDTLEQP